MRMQYTNEADEGRGKWSLEDMRTHFFPTVLALELLERSTRGMHAFLFLST
jgi:hypothetical protein